MNVELRNIIQNIINQYLWIYVSHNFGHTRNISKTFDIEEAELACPFTKSLSTPIAILTPLRLHGKYSHLMSETKIWGFSMTSMDRHWSWFYQQLLQNHRTLFDRYLDSSHHAIFSVAFFCLQHNLIQEVDIWCVYSGCKIFPTANVIFLNNMHSTTRKHVLYMLQSAKDNKSCQIIDGMHSKWIKVLFTL